MKPSELPEGGWIKIAIKPGPVELSKAGPPFEVEPTGAIGFHVYYNQLSCFAINHDQPADCEGLGLLITRDEALADKIFSEWEHMKTVEITGSEISSVES